MTTTAMKDGRLVLHAGDCRDVLRDMADCSVDSVVTDPPYALVSIVKRFGKPGAAPASGNDAYMRASAGFMGRSWDTGETAFASEFWEQVLRVLKPGGHVVAFSGTRSYHRMACAIEDAGFEIRDQLAWCYGAGFPKSHNVSRNLNGSRCSCSRPEAAEQVLQHDMRPLRSTDVSATERVEKERGEILLEIVPEQGAHGSIKGTGPSEIPSAGKESSLEGRGDAAQTEGKLSVGALREVPTGTAVDGKKRRLRNGAPPSRGVARQATPDEDRSSSSQGSPTAQQRAIQPGVVADKPGSQDGGIWPVCGGCGKPIIPDGFGTALKPSWEPICLARKALDGTVAENVLRWGTGAINVDGCRVGTEGGTAKGRSADKSPTDSVGGYLNAKAGAPINAGRWPANIIHDGSDEVVAAFPSSNGAGEARGATPTPGSVWGIGAERSSVPGGATYADSGSAARFFYSAKADAQDRIGSKHPTVKPVDLMQWLCRLVTPPGGVVLDPFAGSGSTGEAALREGFRAILVEREAEYQADIVKRIEMMDAGPATRKAAARRRTEAPGPLFGDNDNDLGGGAPGGTTGTNQSSTSGRRIGPIGLRR